MPRRITSTQLKNQVRKAGQELNRQVKRDLNKAQRKFGRDFDREVSKLDRQVTARNKRAVAKLNTELQRLQNQSTPVRYTVLQRSNLSVQQSYQRLEQRWATTVPSEGIQNILSLAQQEAANSTAALNALEQNESDEVTEDDLSATEVNGLLEQFGAGLERTWKGAMFALNPANPDAARQFCTSAREIFTAIFDLRAPDKDVLLWNAECQKTDRGSPTRRVKIEFMLARKRWTSADLEDFVDTDTEDVLKLFHEFNPATHGQAGKYSLEQLFGLKERSENCLKLLGAIAI